MSALPKNIEKRSYPRVQVLRPMQLIHENGVVVDAKLRDISPSGMQAMCDRESAMVLVPNGSLDLSEGPQVFASFKLPIEDSLVQVEVDCRMIHLSLVENEGVAVGLRFVSFRGSSLDNLRQFVLSSLEPAC